MRLIFIFSWFVFVVISGSIMVSTKTEIPKIEVTNSDVFAFFILYLFIVWVIFLFKKSESPPMVLFLICFSFGVLGFLCNLIDYFDNKWLEQPSFLIPLLELPYKIRNWLNMEHSILSFCLKLVIYLIMYIPIVIFSCLTKLK